MIIRHIDRRWVAIAVVVLALAALSSIVAISMQRGTMNGGASEVLQSDPRSVTALWLIDELELPEEIERRLLTAAGDGGEVDATLAEYFADRPVIEGYQRMAKSHSGTIRDYEAGTLRLGRNEPVAFSLPLDWARNDRGMNFLGELHSLRFLSNFIDGYERAGDREYLEVVERVLADWVEKNPYGNAQHARAWHEGAVAKRTLVLLNLFDAFKLVDPPRALPLAFLLKLLYQHAEYLMVEKTYRPGGNHGIRQDLSLIAASLCLEEFTRSRAWRRTALKRLRAQQVELGFSREGVWCEHSPAYHHYVMALLKDVLDLMTTNGLHDEAEFLRELDADSQEFYTHVLTPLGEFPPVGDSFEDRPNARYIRSPAALYTFTMGREGSPSETLDGYFPDAGQAVFRDTWGRSDRPAEDAFYVHIHAAHHPGFGHRHADELSFLVHGVGRWWILEAGKYGYADDAYRSYVRSPHAHNSITFNGEALANDVSDQNKEVSLEEQFVANAFLAAARATTTRFPADGVAATRTYVFLRERDTLVLLDHLQSARPGDWQNYIHLPPDVTVAAQDDRVEVRAPTHPQHRMDILSESGNTSFTEVVRGQRDPMLGWYSPGFLAITSTPVLVYDRSGVDVLAATVIRIATDPTPAPTDLAMSRSSDAYRISWLEGDERIVIETSTRPPLTITLSIDEEQRQ